MKTMYPVLHLQIVHERSALHSCASSSVSPAAAATTRYLGWAARWQSSSKIATLEHQLHPRIRSDHLSMRIRSLILHLLALQRVPPRLKNRASAFCSFSVAGANPRAETVILRRHLTPLRFCPQKAFHPLRPPIFTQRPLCSRLHIVFLFLLSLSSRS